MPQHQETLSKVLSIFTKDLQTLAKDYEFFTRNHNSIIFKNINQELNRSDYREARKLLDDAGIESWCTCANNLVVYC